MKISDDELRALTDSEIRASVAYLGGKLSEQRRRNEYYYLGLPKGELAPPEIPGRSQVVDTSVRNVIEWMLPSLLKIFTSGDNAVEFTPRHPKDEAASKQATDYINYVFYQQNPGFQLLYTWFKDALIQKAGILKVWWDDRKEDVREEYKGLDEMQVAMLLQDEDVEPISITESEEEDPPAEPDDGAQDDGNEGQPVQPQGPPQQGQPGQSAQPEPAPSKTYDVAIKRVTSHGKVCVEAVPPEEFLISRKAKTIKDTPFVAHRVQKTMSDLKAQGYKNLDDVGSDEAGAGSYNAERIERMSFDDEQPYLPNLSDATVDPSQRVVWLTECYLKADRNGDGIAEWLKVVRAGNALLDVDECDGPPFVAITPIPLPHRFFGLSVADIVVPSATTKTALKRAALDNLYIGVNGRYFAVDGQVNLDDLLVSRPGGVVRVKSPQAVGRLDAGTGDIAGALQMLEYEETDKENASGWTRYSQGTSADALNKTATGTSIITQRSDQRLELIARNFAETGVKDLFLLILKLVSQYQNKPQVLRLTGQWIEVDPRNWKTQFDFTVNVGLGTGDKTQQVQHLMALQQAQQMALQVGYATPQNLYNAAAKMAGAMGFKEPDQFFTSPEKMPPQPPQPDPKMVEVQAKAQAQQAEAQMNAQAEMQRMQMESQATMQRIRMESEAKMQQMQAQMALEWKRFQEQMALDREKAMAEIVLKREQMALDHDLAKERAAHDAIQVQER